MTITVYGIPNCDTVKKARVWLGTNGIAFDFHDYKKEGADAARHGLAPRRAFLLARPDEPRERGGGA